MVFLTVSLNVQYLLFYHCCFNFQAQSAKNMNNNLICSRLFFDARSNAADLTIYTL